MRGSQVNGRPEWILRKIHEDLAIRTADEEVRRLSLPRMKNTEVKL